MPKAEEYSAIEALRDGCLVEIRALQPDDRADLIAAVGRTSDASLYRRFFGLKRSFTDQEAAFFVNVDFVNHVALVALINEKGRSIIAGGGRYIVVQPGQSRNRLYRGRRVSRARNRCGTDASSHEHCPYGRAPDFHRRSTARKHSYATTFQEEWPPIEREARGPGRPCHAQAVLKGASRSRRYQPPEMRRRRFRDWLERVDCMITSARLYAEKEGSSRRCESSC